MSKKLAQFRTGGIDLAISKGKQPKDTLEELRVLSDTQWTPWLYENRARLIAGAITVLLFSGVFSGALWWQQRGAHKAAQDFAAVQRDFDKAMGAEDGAMDYAEPANPETARQVREEYLARFMAVATDHPRTQAAAMAWLEAGRIHEGKGDAAQALEAWKNAVAQVRAQTALRAILLERLATAYEQTGKWEDAAAQHLAAGKIRDFPLRTSALAAAARCYLEAGNTEKALEIYKPISAKEEDLKDVPLYLRLRLDELVAAQNLKRTKS